MSDRWPRPNSRCGGCGGAEFQLESPASSSPVVRLREARSDRVCLGCLGCLAVEPATCVTRGVFMTCDRNPLRLAASLTPPPERVAPLSRLLELKSSGTSSVRGISDQAVQTVGRGISRHSRQLPLPDTRMGLSRAQAPCDGQACT